MPDPTTSGKGYFGIFEPLSCLVLNNTRRRLHSLPARYPIWLLAGEKERKYAHSEQFHAEESLIKESRKRTSFSVCV